MTGSMLGNLTGSQEAEGVLHIIFNKHFILHVCITARYGWVNLKKINNDQFLEKQGGGVVHGLYLLSSTVCSSQAYSRDLGNEQGIAALW